MIEISDFDKETLRRTAHSMADAARSITLKHFRTLGLSSDNKVESGFDPVTVADRGAEDAMRAVLAQMRPDDGILGEEFAPVSGSTGLTWVLDPIDGTRGYISGTPTWGVLIAVSDDAGPRYGIMDQPYIGERFEGGFGVARLVGPHGEAALGVRTGRPLAEAVLFTTFPEVGRPSDRMGFEAVRDHVRLTRYGMDCYAYALLAAGQIDLVIEAGLHPYDIHAPIALIEAAGGVVTNWAGGAAHPGGQIIAAATEQLHRDALALLRPYADA